MSCEIARLSRGSSSSVCTSSWRDAPQTSFFELQTTILPGTNKGKLAQCYAPIIVSNLIPPRTPGARVAAELSPRAWTLQERYPGARAQAPCQKEAQTERLPRPHQLDDGTHADINKAEAAPIESQTLGMSL